MTWQRGEGILEDNAITPSFHKWQYHCSERESDLPEITQHTGWEKRTRAQALNWIWAFSPPPHRSLLSLVNPSFPFYSREQWRPISWEFRFHVHLLWKISKQKNRRNTELSRRKCDPCARIPPSGLAPMQTFKFVQESVPTECPFLLCASLIWWHRRIISPQVIAT